jgi:hypothetical protein
MVLYFTLSHYGNIGNLQGKTKTDGDIGTVKNTTTPQKDWIPVRVIYGILKCQAWNLNDISFKRVGNLGCKISNVFTSRINRRSTGRDLYQSSSSDVPL